MRRIFALDLERNAIIHTQNFTIMPVQPNAVNLSQHLGQYLFIEGRTCLHKIVSVTKTEAKTDAGQRVKIYADKCGVVHATLYGRSSARVHILTEQEANFMRLEIQKRGH